MIKCLAIHFAPKKMTIMQGSKAETMTISQSADDGGDEGIEYKLTDFMQLTDEDIEQLNKFAFIQERISIDEHSIEVHSVSRADAPSFIDAPSASEEESDLLLLIDSDLVDSTIASAADEYSEKYSVYNNYDELFFSVVDNESTDNITIRSSWIVIEEVENNQQHDVIGYSREEGGVDLGDWHQASSVISTEGVDDSSSTAPADASNISDMVMEDQLMCENFNKGGNEGEEQYQSIALAVSNDAENTEILKKLVVQCLARNRQNQDDGCNAFDGSGSGVAVIGIQSQTESIIETKLSGYDGASVNGSYTSEQYQKQVSIVSVEFPRDPSTRDSVVPMRLPRDPSMTESADSIEDSRNDEEEEKKKMTVVNLRLPRDPSLTSMEGVVPSSAWKVSRDPSVHSITKEIVKKDSRNEKVMPAIHDPPKRDPPEDVLPAANNRHRKLKNGILHQNKYIMISRDLPSKIRQPPRPDIVRYGNKSQTSPTAFSRQPQLLQQRHGNAIQPRMCSTGNSNAHEIRPKVQISPSALSRQLLLQQQTALHPDMVHCGNAIQRTMRSSVGDDDNHDVESHSSRTSYSNQSILYPATLGPSSFNVQCHSSRYSLNNEGHQNSNMSEGPHQQDLRDHDSHLIHNPVVPQQQQQSLSGPSILRRRRYKELLLKQHRAASRKLADFAAAAN